jgi:hypothetical protein
MTASRKSIRPAPHTTRNSNGRRTASAAVRTTTPRAATVNTTPRTGPGQSRTTTTVEAKPGTRDVSRAAGAEAAYFLWLKRGGDDVANWLEAEASLRSAAGSF